MGVHLLPWIRRVRPSDSAALAEFYAWLEPDTLRQRFLSSARVLSDAAARKFCTLDHRHDEGFIALGRDDAGERVVGHLCLVETGPRQLEIGVCIAEAYQGRGLGHQLFDAAIAWAHAQHYLSIEGTCFANNSRVLALLASAPHGATVSAASAGTVEVAIPLSGLSPRCRASSPRTPLPAHAAAG